MPETFLLAFVEGSLKVFVTYFVTYLAYVTPVLAIFQCVGVGGGEVSTCHYVKVMRPFHCISCSSIRQAELMVVGRLVVLVLSVVSILWLPLLQIVQGSQFWLYMQSVGAFTVPPITMTFISGMFSGRITEQVVVRARHIISHLDIAVLDLATVMGSRHSSSRFRYNAGSRHSKV